MYWSVFMWMTFSAQLCTCPQLNLNNMLYTHLPYAAASTCPSRLYVCWFVWQVDFCSLMIPKASMLQCYNNNHGIHISCFSFLPRIPDENRGSSGFTYITEIKIFHAYAGRKKNFQTHGPHWSKETLKSTTSWTVFSARWCVCLHRSSGSWCSYILICVFFILYLHILAFAAIKGCQICS